MVPCCNGTGSEPMVVIFPRSKCRDAKAPVVRILRLASLAEVAMPVRLLQDNLRREGALAGLVAEQLGQPKFFMLKALFRLVNLGFDLLEKLISPSLFFGTPVLSGADFTKQGDAFAYCDKCLADSLKHATPLKHLESPEPITPPGGLH